MDLKTIILSGICVSLIGLYLLTKWDMSKLKDDTAREKEKLRKDLVQKERDVRERLDTLAAEKTKSEKEVIQKKVTLEQNFQEKTLSSNYWQQLNDENRAYHVEKLNGLKEQLRKSYDIIVKEADAAYESNRLKDATMYAEICVLLKPEDQGAQRLKQRIATIRPTNKLGMAFVKIPKGEFKMGSLPTEKMRGTDEDSHKVIVTKDFFMMETEVTQQQWDAVMNTKDGTLRDEKQISTPSETKGANMPVENIAYFDINIFLAKINNLGIGQYRLPTEAEWEYAARANEKGPFGDNAAPEATAWYSANSQRKLQEVRKKFPNSFGLFDMLGNVSEWVSDMYAPFTNETATDPQNKENTGNRVFKGGSFKDSENNCRIAKRNKAKDDFKAPNLGFRLIYEAN